MALQIDDKIIDEKNLSKEAKIAIENINQLNNARDSLILNLERNRILINHYSQIVKDKVKMEDKK